MKYRFLYIVICIAFLSLSVKAGSLDLDDAVIYLSFNNDFDNDRPGNFFQVNTGSVGRNTYSKCKIQSCAYFGGTNTRLEYNNSNLWKLGDYSTINFWVSFNNTAIDGFIVDTKKTSSDQGYSAFRIASGNHFYYQFGDGTVPWASASVDNTPTFSSNTMYFISIVRDDSVVRFYVNGVLNKTTSGLTANNYTYDSSVEMWIGENLEGAGSYEFYGYLDEMSFYKKALNVTQILALYNSGSGYNPFTDVSAPTFGTVNQNPTNLTIFNAIVNLLRVNVSITDDTGVNTSSVKLNLNVSKSARYINGTYYSMKNQIISYNNTASNFFHFWLDESDYLSATYNIKHEWFENTTHSPYNLSSATSWVKTRFFNVSSKTELAVVEYYDSAMTSTDTTKVFYYCNSSYVSGKPTTSPYCTQFWSGSNQNAYDHTHVGSKSKHKMYPLGIDTATGTINGIGVTNTSYILKKGTDEGESVWYINRLARTGTTQTSTNNGVTWTSQTWTVDSHLHQVYNGSTLTYNVCASDTLGYKGCATTKTDLIDFTHVNPSVPLITSPVSGNYSDDTLNITYTSSIPTLPCVVNSYKLYYKKSTSSTWTYLLENYPNLNYVWDISGLDEGNYNVRVNVTDTCSQKVFSLSDTFEIDFVTESELLLSSIDSTLDSVYEVLNMIPIIMMYFGLIAIGYWFSQTGNHWVSLPFLFASTGISFYLWKYYDGLEIPEIGLMFAGLTLGSVIMWIFLNSRRVKTHSEIM